MADYRKLFDLTGKTAVVLGAASGIGKSSAEALAGLGARVVCAGGVTGGRRPRFAPPGRARRRPIATGQVIVASVEVSNVRKSFEQFRGDSRRLDPRRGRRADHCSGIAEAPSQATLGLAS